MVRKKNSVDDFKFEIVQGPEMTEEDLDAIASICARIINDQIMKEQQAHSGQNPNENNDQSTPTVKNE